MGNGTLDKEWPTCMACAVLSRSLTRTGTPFPAACNSCFERYCWNGTTDSRAPAGNYTPTYKLSEMKISGASTAVAGVGRWGVVVAVVGGLLLI